MVLFNDTLPPKPKTLFSKCLTWFLRILFTLITLTLICLGCLNLLQGNGDTQKSGLEKTIDSLTGRQTNIRQLGSFQLFPELHIQMNGIKNGLFSDKSIHVQSFDVKAPGVSIFTQNGIFNHIDIQGIQFLSGTDLIHRIDSIYISDENKISPRLIINFSKPQNLKVELELKDHYKLKKNALVNIHWDGGQIEGRLMNNTFFTGKGSIHSSILDLPEEDIDCFFARFSLSANGLKLSNIWLKSESESLKASPEIQFSYFDQPSLGDVSKLMYDPQITNSACASFIK